ncbi:MAG: thioredoxin [Deltaproteobacteria bacterium]|nr:thioredoxin [Deltaproteobacteria bacterium]
MAGNLLEINDDSFEAEVIKSDIPVLVDFWAPWCGPCKAMGPVLEEISKDFEGKLKVCKCNVDDSPVTPGNFGIRAIPTLILFNNGEKANQMVGMMEKSKLVDAINAIL